MTPQAGGQIGISNESRMKLERWSLRNIKTQGRVKIGKLILPFQKILLLLPVIGTLIT